MRPDMLPRRGITRSISASQCRAARGMANWSTGRLSREAKVPIADIVALERGRRLIPATTLRSLIQAFERHDIDFLPDEGLRLVRGTLDLVGDRTDAAVPEEGRGDEPPPS
ncbi:helix-turn-helix transcriptional regulator [Aurantimonas endophytica]|uniref:XRE family transcriptional regulator n=1 Tax=Aurantimonas endophytica TaxID=1522175 RepID=A0A7W6HAX4_9HYPH|nr:helix-turn-helix transcriptional regulator [Aurantimonas endophytica]MBB4001854.1 hypothetical protein [Aurantimonas endophytica]MCO6402509.1 hypothetical protein [Aurantimonas endophytica]